MKTAVQTNLQIYDRSVAPIEDMLLNYRLYHENDSEQPEGFQDIFSLEITMTHGDKHEKVNLKDISRDRRIALEIAEIFVEGEVDPCSAFYIIEELLSDPRFI